MICTPDKIIKVYMINIRKNELKFSEIEIILKEICNILKLKEINNPYIIIKILFAILNIKNDFLEKKINSKIPKIKATELKKIKLFKIESAGYIVDYIFQNKLDNTKNNSINKRKFTGSYFTPYPIASYICKKTIKKFKGIKILDPCCGTGVFLSAATHLLKKSGLENNEIIKSIYAFDINEDALLIAKILISIELNLNKNESHKLWLGNNFKTIDFVFYNSNQFDFFNSNLPDNNFYNYIVANPPYERLKPDKQSDINRKKILEYISKIKKENFELSSSGNINLYKLFLEKIIQLINKYKSEAGIIIPSTFTNDLTCLNLRKELINKKIIKEILIIPEKIKIFQNVSQAFSIINFGYADTNNAFKIGCLKKEQSLDQANFEIIKFKVIKEIFSENYNLINLNKNEISLVLKLNKLKKIKNIGEIINKRGEVDLTIYKNFLNKGEKKLLRGKNVDEFSIKGEYSQIDLKEFLIKTNSKFHLNERLACQQISNMDSKKRLKFVKVPKGILLANSLNFIMLKKHNNDFLNGLYLILNSWLMDWYFKLFSSNNHINNYQIDLLPMPSYENIIKIGKMKNDFLLNSKIINNREKFETQILKIYGCLDFEKLFKKKSTSLL